MIYDEIVNEYGFDPFAPGPALAEWQPWTIQGALEALGVGIVTELPDMREVSLETLLGLPTDMIEVSVAKVLNHADQPESITSGYNPNRLD